MRPLTQLFKLIIIVQALLLRALIVDLDKNYPVGSPKQHESAVARRKAFAYPPTQMAGNYEHENATLHILMRLLDGNE